MYIQEKPYIPFAAAMIFAALPLALLMHELAALLFGARGLLLAEQGGHYALAGYWRDSTVWFVCGVFGFLNIPLSAGLAKIAHRKMMRRRWRLRCFWRASARARRRLPPSLSKAWSAAGPWAECAAPAFFITP